MFEYLQEHDNEIYCKLRSSWHHKTLLAQKIKHIEDIEKEHVEKLQHMDGMPDAAQLGLTQERLDAIKGGLKMTTFRIDIDPDQREAILTHPSGTHFKTIKLDDESKCKLAHYMQLASVFIELVLFVLSVAGITVPIDETLIGSISEELAEKFAASIDFNSAVTNLMTSWFEEGASLFTKAKTLYEFLENIHKIADIFWNGIKLFFEKMSITDWLETAVLTLAQLIAAFGSGGVALIAKILLALYSAVEFIRKISNLKEVQKCISSVTHRYCILI